MSGDGAKFDPLIRGTMRGSYLVMAWVDKHRQCTNTGGILHVEMGETSRCQTRFARAFRLVSRIKGAFHKVDNFAAHAAAAVITGFRLCPRIFFPPQHLLTGLTRDRCH